MQFSKICFHFQSVINTDVETLPINDALLQLVGNPVSPNSGGAHLKLIPVEDQMHYLAAKCCIEELALYLKPCQATPSTGNSKALGFCFFEKQIFRYLLKSYNKSIIY